ncbi:protein kinase [Fervidobacterium sp. 2310opik-2]|uniref:serine/threonine protein kinase n=1 Tax=Fervidobacterium sp. 2310opik-2 TaxID=1755815 RepID=UPI0013DFCC9C|nr:protein kinase [Fervidobacterium sp. 2310opik-2]KAF2961066.1 hypothetical protein AS161_03565 [Fervidobacterium sp. 2310opik-2]
MTLFNTLKILRINSRKEEDNSTNLSNPKDSFTSEKVDNILQIKKGNNTYLVPKIIGNRYVINDVLSASSGFGFILIASDKNVFGRKVLIKATNYKNRIRRQNLENEEIIKKRRWSIKYELNVLRYMRILNIPNTPVIRDYIEDYNPTIQWPDGKVDSGAPLLEEYAYNEPYIVLQYIQGFTLDKLIIEEENKNSRDWQMFTLNLAKQLLKFFRKMSRVAVKDEKISSFVYQDLKPENIIVTPSKNIALIDFGGVATITKDGRVLNYGVGTPGYMPPEVANPSLKSEFNERADIYTLGMLMYEMLTGISPSKFLTKDKFTAKVDYSELNCYEELKDIIVKATQPNPKDRYQNTSEMLDDVMDVLNNINLID